MGTEQKTALVQLIDAVKRGERAAETQLFLWYFLEKLCNLSPFPSCKGKGQSSFILEL